MDTESQICNSALHRQKAMGNGFVVRQAQTIRSTQSDLHAKSSISYFITQESSQTGSYHLGQTR